MFSSASTWLYNATLKVSASLDPGKGVAGHFMVFDADVLTVPPDPDVLVVKTHGMEAAAERWLADRAQAIIITIRDPRDAIASLMEHNGFPFGIALDLTNTAMETCARWLNDPRSTLLRYEDGFAGDPATIQQLAMILGSRLPAGVQGRIFSELRREAVEEFIQRLPSLPTTVHNHQLDDVFDSVTHWHRHHAGRNGEVGRWISRLVPGQVTIVESTLRPWIERFGYAMTAGRVTFESV